MTNFYPSPVVKLKITHQGRTIELQILEKEAYLVREIFENEEYGLLPPRSHADRRRVLDVGANVGLFAVYMKLKYPRCIVHCYEPAPAALALCRANVMPFGDDVAIHEYGLFNRDQTGLLYLHRDNTGQNSIHPLAATGATVQIDLHDAGGEWDRLGWDYLDVLKIDTEGCEVEILESLGPRVEQIDYVHVEHHSDDDRRRIDALLADFQLYAARMHGAGLGVCSYVNRRLVAARRPGDTSRAPPRSDDLATHTGAAAIEQGPRA